MIDSQLGILKRSRPYHDSEHVLNIAYNILCGGQVLDDIEVRRNDAAFLDLLGARAIPDPTTAGDFCRRFDEEAIWRPMRLINGCGLRTDPVGAAQRVRFAVVQLQAASLRTAPPSIVGVSTSSRIARPHLTPDRGAHAPPRRRGGA